MTEEAQPIREEEYNDYYRTVDRNLAQVLEMEPLIEHPEVFERSMSEGDLADFPVLRERFIQETAEAMQNARSVAESSGKNLTEVQVNFLQTGDDQFNPYRVNKLGSILTQAKLLVLENPDLNEPLTSKTTDQGRVILGDMYEAFKARIIELSVILGEKKSSGQKITAEEAKEIFAIGKVARFVVRETLGAEQTDDLEKVLKGIKLQIQEVPEMA